MKNLLYILLLILFSTKTQAQITGDNYPVQAHVFVNGAGSLKLSDYFTSSTKLSVDLILKDLTKSSLDVYLSWEIEGLGLGIQAGSSPGFVPGSFISLNRGSVRKLNGLDLREYFQPGVVLAAGLSETAIFSGSLPEGFYVLRVRAYEAGTGREVSNRAETYFSVAYALPPMLNQPLNASEFAVTRPQNVPLQWTPRHTSTGSNLVTYQIKVCEVSEDDEPNVAILGSQTCFTVPQQTATSYLLKASDLPLKPGKRYAWQVQATDLNGALEFQNTGFSEVAWFRFGKACTAPEGLAVAEIGPNRVNLSWKADPQAVGYKVYYKNETAADWQTLSTFGTSLSINGLDKKEPYSFKISTLCDIDNESPTSPEETWEAEEIDTELQDLIDAVLHPLDQISSSSTLNSNKTVVNTSSPDIPATKAATEPLPTSIADLIPTDPAKIPCVSQVRGYENCSDSHASVTPGGSDPIMLNIGDPLTIYDMLAIVTEISENEPYSGKALVKLPFLDDLMMSVEFSNVEIKAQLPVAKGGCVTNVPSNGFFRARTGLSREELKAEEVALIDHIRKARDPESTYTTLGQQIDQYDQTSQEIADATAAGESLSTEQKEALLAQTIALNTQMTHWLENADELIGGTTAGDAILAQIQAILDQLTANQAAIEAGTSFPSLPNLGSTITGITDQIRNLLDTPPTDTPRIQNLQANNITDHSATLTWQGDKRFTKYIVTLQKPGEGERIFEVPGTKLKVENLEKESNYQVKVKGIYGSETIQSENIMFSTLKSSFPPIENLLSTEDSNGATNLTWDKNKKHFSYKLEYFDTNGSLKTIYTTKNSLVLEDIFNLGSLVKVTAFSSDKKEFSDANRSLKKYLFSNNGGILEKIEMLQTTEICTYSGTCYYMFGCLDDGASRSLKTYVDPSSGFCSSPFVSNCRNYTNPVMTGYDVKENCSLPPMVFPPIPFDPNNPTTFPKEEKCVEGLPTGQQGARVNAVESNFDQKTCRQECLRTLFGDRAQLFCPDETGFAFGCGFACYVKGFFEKLLSNKSSGKVKPKKDDGIYEDDKDNGINETPTGQQAFEMMILPIYPTVSTPEPKGCPSSIAAASVPQCYLESIAKKSPNYESATTLAVNPDKTYSEVPVKAAPNGDFYYVQNGIEYWKITGKYTIARKPDGTWMSYDFASGQWCSFQPAQIILNVEKQIVCNATELVTLKTNGNPPFSYIVRNASGEIIEQSNLLQITFNDLKAGRNGFSVKDANGCFSQEIIENIEQDNGLSLSISALKECNNTVELFGQCGSSPYQYSIDGLNFQTSNRFSGLQNHLILNNLLSYTFTFYLKDASGKMVQKSLKVDRVETMVKLKTKTLRVNNKSLFSQMSLRDYSSQSNFFIKDYIVVKRFEKNGLFGAKTRQYGCKLGSVELSFPYSKLPIDLTLTSSNGTVITKQITSINYTLENLANGKYSISGKDADGCDLEIADQEFNEVEIQSNLFEFNAEIQKRTCASNQSNLKLTIKNTLSEAFPLPVRQYKIFVNEVLVQEFSSTKNTEIRTLTIASGTNSIKVEEAIEGCEMSKTVEVPAVQALSATVRSFPACNSDTTVPITLYITPAGGEQPYTYTLQSALKTISGNANIIPDLANMAYQGTITDKAGCQATFNYTPEPLTLTAIASNPTCGANGTIELNATSGTAPHQYSFDAGSTWQASSTQDGLCPATFGPFKVKDANGCEATTDAVTLTAPETLELAPADAPIAFANARTGQTDEDDYITLTFEGKTVRVKIGANWEYMGNGTSDILVNGKAYTPFFIACSKEFYGFYETTCTASPCTITTYENSACGDGETVRLVFNGQERCKECWLEGVFDDKKGEYFSYEEYMMDLGSKALPFEVWIGQDAHWLSSDRENCTDRWQNACWSIIKNDLKNRLEPFSQIRDFYKWVRRQIEIQGHEVRWALGADLLVDKLSLLENFPEIIIPLEEKYFDLLKELNLEIANYSLHKWKELLIEMENIPIVGQDAYNWDKSFIYEEQGVIAPPIYLKYETIYPESIVRMNSIVHQDLTDNPIESTLNLIIGFMSGIPKFDNHVSCTDTQYRIDFPLKMLYPNMHNPVHGILLSRGNQDFLNVPFLPIKHCNP